MRKEKVGPKDQKHHLYSRDYDIVFVIDETVSQQDCSFFKLEIMYFLTENKYFKTYTNPKVGAEKTVFSTPDDIYKGSTRYSGLKHFMSYREYNQFLEEDGFHEGEFVEGTFFIDYRGSYAPTHTLKNTSEKVHEYFKKQDLSIIFEKYLDTDGSIVRIVPLCIFKGTQKPTHDGYEPALWVRHHNSPDVPTPMQISYYYDEVNELIFNVAHELAKIDDTACVGHLKGFKSAKEEFIDAPFSRSIILNVSKTNKPPLTKELFINLKEAQLTFIVRQYIDADTGSILSWDLLGIRLLQNKEIEPRDIEHATYRQAYYDDFIPSPSNAPLGLKTVSGKPIQQKVEPSPLPETTVSEIAKGVEKAATSDSATPQTIVREDVRLVSNLKTFPHKRKRHLCYCPEDNITVIMEDVVATDIDEVVITQVKGFFFGKGTGGKIDYTYGKKASYVNLDDKNKPRKVETREFIIFCPPYDYSFVMKEVTNGVTGDFISLEVTGFFCGESENGEEDFGFGDIVDYDYESLKEYQE